MKRENLSERASGNRGARTCKNDVNGCSSAGTSLLQQALRKSRNESSDNHGLRGRVHPDVSLPDYVEGQAAVPVLDLRSLWGDIQDSFHHLSSEFDVSLGRDGLVQNRRADVIFHRHRLDANLRAGTDTVEHRSPLVLATHNEYCAHFVLGGSAVRVLRRQKGRFGLDARCVQTERAGDLHRSVLAIQAAAEGDHIFGSIGASGHGAGAS